MNDSDTSETASTGNAGQKIAGNVPIPAFLRQSKGEIHKKFIDLEWQQRNRLLMGTQKPTSPDTPISPWKRVMGEDVTKRNRYFNVDPFVANRVRLKVPEGHSDYINASPIKLFDSETHVGRSFIATQGPKEDIAAHMWRMIWHETTSPAVIVMLTQTHESGKEKCFQYFPHSMDSPVQIINENDEFGDGFTATLTLKSIEEDTSTRSTIRELELKNAEGETKVVWHLLFGGWPDFLIPEGEDRAALIKLVALSSSKNAADSPRIVHCSAGVGRSGTFIALDYLLHELEEGNLDEVSKDEDPISDAVDELRKQRMMMVQGEQQYWFLYDVLRDLWVERWLRLKGQKDGEGNVEDFVKGQVESTPEVEAERVSVRKRGELEMELQGNVDRL
ncbi:phosphatases II [Tothia fuscella]|uniref:Phosphatases II n=1 Tax=Tothia fuscella TaxID=1048955 RepID=A0A9P4TWH8_9PEZI|nr:phosphatases II [Tothia fuscella]